jgi:hypothetical protein
MYTETGVLLIAWDGIHMYTETGVLLIASVGRHMTHGEGVSRLRVHMSTIPGY